MRRTTLIMDAAGFPLDVEADSHEQSTSRSYPYSRRFLAGACTGSRTSESTGEYVDDSVISNKVRGQLLGDKDLNITQIDIETYKGVVQSGLFSSPYAGWYDRA